MDGKAWNGGTRAATRATLIFVHMLRTYPSLMDDACGFLRARRDKDEARNAGLIEQRRRSWQTRLDKAQLARSGRQVSTMHDDSHRVYKCYA